VLQVARAPTSYVDTSRLSARRDRSRLTWRASKLALSVLVQWIAVENKKRKELPHGIYDLWIALEREPDDEPA
jgi:hypothetical protein